MTGLIVVVVVAVIVLLFLSAAVKVVREYERGVVFRLGRCAGRRAGTHPADPASIDRMVKVDLRTITIDVPPQEVITQGQRHRPRERGRLLPRRRPAGRDRPGRELHGRDLADRTDDAALGPRPAPLDELLSERDKINAILQEIIDEETEPWGVKVTIVEVKDVELPDTMQRAMARQAEAERERRAKVINAEGEFQASQELPRPRDGHGRARWRCSSATCRRCSRSGDELDTIVFPIPIDMLTAFMGKATGEAGTDS